MSRFGAYAVFCRDCGRTSQVSKSVALALVLLGAVVPARAAGIFAADSQLDAEVCLYR